MADLSDSLPAGTNLKEFRIERILGSGTFGITYAATDAAGDAVAIKEYFPVQFADRDRESLTVIPRGESMRDALAWGKDRFLREADILGKLNHPNVIGIKHLFQANGTAYIVMPLETGDTLDVRLRRRGPLRDDEARALFSPLIAGIAEVHAQDILHRDVKPSNIIIRAKTGQPVLLDFGSARVFQAGDAKSLTEVLTPGYAPLEQYTPADQGPWTDVYGLAATLFKTVIGKNPPDALRRNDAFMAGKVDPVIKAIDQSENKGRIELSTYDAIRDGMALHRTDRPQTMTQFWAVYAGDAAGTERAVKRPVKSPNYGTPSGGLHRGKRQGRRRDRRQGDSASAAEGTIVLRQQATRTPRWRRAGAVVASALVAFLAGYVANKTIRDPVTRCDSAAGYRYDPVNKGSGEGVRFGDIDADFAIRVCSRALTKRPDLARLRFQLARAHERKKDYRQAAALYRKAASAGSAPARWSLGLMVLKGRGVNRDREQGLSLIRQAARKGVFGAYISLGWHHWRGPQKNLVKAYFWYRLAEKHEPGLVQRPLKRIAAELTSGQKSAVERWLADRYTRPPEHI